MSDETTLLPCPFCGGEAAIVPTLDTTVREWFVTCGNLECNVLACRTKRYYTEAEAIAAWNVRTDDYRQAAEYWQRMYKETFAERTCECVSEYAESPFDGKAIVLHRCSECHELMRPHMRYCPNCGCKVVGDD